MSADTLSGALLENNRRRPEQVFTPKAVVSREMFERRNENDPLERGKLQEVLEDALREEGAQIVIYGDTGVGKTSLLKYASEDSGLELLVVNCTSQDSFDSLIDKTIRSVINVREISYTSSAGREVSAEGALEAGGKVSHLITMKGSLRLARKSIRSTQSQFEVVSLSPVDALKDAMYHAGIDIISFDNFQNISSSSDRRLVAELMEHLSDDSSETGNLKVAVVGIADDVEKLISDSGSFRRRTTELEVPRMPDDEISSILKHGFMMLEMELDDSVLDDIVFYSDGFPFFAHLIGLAVARVVRREGAGGRVERVTWDHLDSAIRSAIQSVNASYAPRYKSAVEASGKTRPRATILDVLANSSQREWRSPEIISAWREKNGDRSSYEFLYTALGQLSGDGYGRVLRRKGTATNYSYRFQDPYMRPYIRLLNNMDLKVNILPEK